MMKREKSEKRVSQIRELRDSGCTFAEIAQRLGISRQRVYQVHIGVVRRKLATQPGDWLHDAPVSVRLYNALAKKHCGLSEEEIREMPDRELLKIKNLGRVSLTELRRLVPGISPTACPTCGKLLS